MNFNTIQKGFKNNLFLHFICVCVVNGGGSTDYRNYTLYRAVASNESHLEFFGNLSQKYFWRPPGSLHNPFEFVLPPEEQRRFEADAAERGIYLTTLMADVQSAFDKQTVKTYVRRNLESYNWQSFFRLKDMYSWLKDLQSSYPDEMKLINIGTTWEQRKIIAVKITLKGCKFRSKVMIEGGIHAREWIAPAFVTYMIQEILRAPTGNDSNLKRIANTYEWIFVPVVNPDGYEYSHTEDRLWRKNRRHPSGVDLNRNFGFAFSKVGVSHAQKSDIYCGPTPFSEKETVAVSEFIRRNSPNLEYYIAFHSYGQYMIIPYAHSTEHLQNFDEVKSMGDEAARVIQKKYNTKYHVGTAYDTVGYKTSGVSSCWVKSTFAVPYVMTFELRDNGEWGFALPPNLILPTCQETMDGVLAFLMPRSDRYERMHGNPVPDGEIRNSLCRSVLCINALVLIKAAVL